MRYGIILIFILSFILLVNKAFSTTNDEARLFVDGLGQKVLDVINSPLSEAEKQKQLQQMFVENVDIEWMSNFVLAQGRKQATEDQKIRYMNAYKKYLLARYTKNFSDYTGSKYTITGVKDEGNGEFSVAMQIKATKQQAETIAGYRLLTQSTGEFRIIDIIVEGVSLITTQRADFDSVLSKSGIEGLIKAIEEKAQVEQSGGSKSPKKGSK